MCRLHRIALLYCTVGGQQLFLKQIDRVSNEPINGRSLVKSQIHGTQFDAGGYRENTMDIDKCVLCVPFLVEKLYFFVDNAFFSTVNYSWKCFKNCLDGSLLTLPKPS